MHLGIDASNIRAGGGVTHLVELLKHACPQEEGIERVTIWLGDQLKEKVPDRSWLECIHVPVLNQSLPARVFWQTLELSRMARHAGVNLLFAPGGTFIGDFRPFVTMSQNLLPFELSELRRFGVSKTALRLLALRKIQSFTFQQANGVVFLTEYARQCVEKQMGIDLSGKSAIVPHGINERFRREPREQLEPSAFTFDNPFRVLYVSIVNLYKHQWHVVDAVARLRARGVPITVDFVGPAYSPALKLLEKHIAEVDVDRHFAHYHGPVPYIQLEQWYQQADAFVFASSCENMPNILVEAMASGLPIACSDRQPMPEVLRESGLYFDPEEPLSIADAILTLYTQRTLRERYAWSGYQRATEFSWERCARETFSYLFYVAQQSRRRIQQPV